MRRLQGALAEGFPPLAVTIVAVLILLGVQQAAGFISCAAGSVLQLWWLLIVLAVVILFASRNMTVTVGFAVLVIAAWLVAWFAVPVFRVSTYLVGIVGLIATAGAIRQGWHNVRTRIRWQQLREATGRMASYETME